MGTGASARPVLGPTARDRSDLCRGQRGNETGFRHWGRREKSTVDEKWMDMGYGGMGWLISLDSWEKLALDHYHSLDVFF